MSYFHPDRAPVLPTRRREAARRQLEQVVERSRTSRKWRAKPATILAGSVAVVLTTGAATFAVIEYQPISSESVARCYTTPDLAGYYTTANVPGDPGSQAQAQEAFGYCSGLFGTGQLTLGGAGVAPLQRSHTLQPVPNLVVCALPSSIDGVFPGDPSTCASLGFQSAIQAAVP